MARLKAWMPILLLALGSFPHPAAAQTRLSAPIPLDRRPGTKVVCLMQFGVTQRYNDCKLVVTDAGLTLYLEQEGERRSNRRSQGDTSNDIVSPLSTQEIQIPFNSFQTLNVRTWSEFQRDPTLLTSTAPLTDEVNDEEKPNSGRFAQIEINYVTATASESGNRSNFLQMLMTDEYGITLYRSLQPHYSSDSPSAEVVARSTPASGDRAALQQLLETKACVRCDLRGAQLDDANLENANLEGANLEGATLGNAKLENAYLVGANLDGANLTKANLNHARLMLASLIGANLSNAEIRGINLQSADLHQANLQEADLSLDSWLNFTVLNKANLSEVNLSRANLRGVELDGANLTNANLASARLGNKGLSYGPFDSEYYSALVGTLRTLFLTTRLSLSSRTSFIGANLSGANLSETNLKDSFVTDANLSGVNLTDAEIDQENLATLNLCRATLPNGSTSNQGCGS